MALERNEPRDYRRTLTGSAAVQAKMSAILGDGSLSIDDKKKELSEVRPTFTSLRYSASHLTMPDRSRIASDVATSIRDQLAAPSLFPSGALSAVAPTEPAPPAF